MSSKLSSFSLSCQGKLKNKRLLFPEIPFSLRPSQTQCCPHFLPSSSQEGPFWGFPPQPFQSMFHAEVEERERERESERPSTFSLCLCPSPPLSFSLSYYCLISETLSLSLPLSISSLFLIFKIWVFFFDS